MKRSTAPAVIFRRGCSQVFNKIREFQPAAIVAVEVAAGEMAALARQKGITEARLVSVITDHEAEPAWANDKVDAYAVADNHVRNHLLRWGAKGSRIEVTGIAVDQSFTDVSQPSRKSESSPLVLLMGGGMGPTRMDQVVARLIESAVPMRIIAVAGHDRRTLRKLVRLTGTPPVSLEVVEWTNEVATLMKAATLIITKPGGVTITEAALCGLPVVLFDPIPGPEQSNAARLAEAGAAVITSGSQDTAAAVIELLRDERARRAIAVKARQFVKPNAAANIAEIVLRHALHENHFAKTMKAGTGR